MNKRCFFTANKRTGAITEFNIKTETGSGIGLDNVKKRLNLIYGKKYKMKITEKPEEFKVELQIPISLWFAV